MLTSDVGDMSRLCDGRVQMIAVGRGSSAWRGTPATNRGDNDGRVQP
jgi:hypothetical protein